MRARAAVAAFAALGAACGDAPSDPPTMNRAPRFVHTPQVRVLHDRRYVLDLAVADEDGDDVEVLVPVRPAWLAFDTAGLLLTGTPGPDNIGDHAIRATAFDGTDRTTLAITVTAAPDLATLVYDGSWVDAGFVFGHDGSPVRSANFIVYSGFSAPAEREWVAARLEDGLSRLEGMLGITSHAEFEYPGAEAPIDVLTLRYQGQDEMWTGVSYRYGLVVHAPDSRRYVEEGYTRSIYPQLLNHELMHVVEYLLVGKDRDYSAVERWFHEGIATYLAGTPPSRITQVAQVESWRYRMRDFGGGNPVAIRTAADFPADVASDVETLSEYYRFFELAVRYLLDPAGLGKSPADVRQLYLDIRNGASFRTAFQSRVGLSVEQYQAGFFDLMTRYLGG